MLVIGSAMVSVLVLDADRSLDLSTSSLHICRSKSASGGCALVGSISSTLPLSDTSQASSYILGLDIDGS